MDISRRDVFKLASASGLVAAGLAATISATVWLWLSVSAYKIFPKD